MTSHQPEAAICRRRIYTASSSEAAETAASAELEHRRAITRAKSLRRGGFALKVFNGDAAVAVPARVPDQHLGET